MYIDAHAHLDRYPDDTLDSALAEITQHEIFTVSNSMDLPSYRRNQEIAARCELVLPIFGVHPWNAPQYVGHLEELAAAIEASPILGEIGLDHHFVEDAAQYPAQQTVLEHFLAQARGKIVNLHTKGAEGEVLRLLERHDVRRVIVHWYSGPLDVFEALAARGACFTVGVEVRYSEHIQTIAKRMPAGQLLTETDNPGGPRSLIGALGMPRLVMDVVQTLAALRGATGEEIVRLVEANFLRLTEGDAGLAGVRARVVEG
jgi:TatD DNase family protein